MSLCCNQLSQSSLQFKSFTLLISKRQRKEQAVGNQHMKSWPRKLYSRTLVQVLQCLCKPFWGQPVYESRKEEFSYPQCCTNNIWCSKPTFTTDTKETNSKVPWNCTNSYNIESWRTTDNYWRTSQERYTPKNYIGKKILLLITIKSIFYNYWGIDFYSC